MKEDGGSAFPEIITTPAWETSSEGYTIYGKVSSVGGMSLRDYFAAKAMQSIISMEELCIPNEFVDRPISDFISRLAYEYADAMLKAREGDNERT